ncbi:MAG: SgcJ/EcaC family oxidoreductase [Acidobacteriia bacterium]|nr:SgcJ/EcaC family oxidoreductase [Terriglobia bacterium]
MPTTADEVELHISKIGEQWARHWNAGDLDKLIQAYAPDAVYMPPHHPAVHGRDAIYEYLKTPIKHGVGELTYEVTFIKHSADLAYDVGRYSMSVPRDGGLRQDRGKYLTVWRRQPNAEWLIVADTWSSDLPSTSG